VAGAQVEKRATLYKNGPGIPVSTQQYLLAVRGSQPSRCLPDPLLQETKWESCQPNFNKRRRTPLIVPKKNRFQTPAQSRHELVCIRTHTSREIAFLSLSPHGHPRDILQRPPLDAEYSPVLAPSASAVCKSDCNCAHTSVVISEQFS
jgi:hypothetical protein